MRSQSAVTEPSEISSGAVQVRTRTNPVSEQRPPYSYSVRQYGVYSLCISLEPFRNSARHMVIHMQFGVKSLERRLISRDIKLDCLTIARTPTIYMGFTYKSVGRCHGSVTPSGKTNLIWAMPRINPIGLAHTARPRLYL